MPNFFRYCVSSVLILSCLFTCNTTSQRERAKHFEVPTSNTIRLNDGKQHYYHFSSEFTTRNPVINFESSERLAQFYVSVMNTTKKGDCKAGIHIKRTNTSPLILCYGSAPTTILLAGNFSMDIKAPRSTATEVHVMRFLNHNESGFCQNRTDYHCGRRCFWADDILCDGQKHCFRGGDEKGCGVIKFWASYSGNNVWLSTNSGNSTTPETKRHCALPGVSVDGPYKSRFNAASYTTGIIVLTIFCSIVMGFCFMQPYIDEEEMEQERRRAFGERRLDPVYDHPPSYEDVLHMDLTAAPHAHSVPKHQITQSSENS